MLLYLELLSSKLPFEGIKQLSESAPTPVKEKKPKVPPRPSYSRKRHRTASGFSSGLGDRSPTKSAKIESATSDPISIETIREETGIPSTHEVVSLLSDSPKKVPIAGSSVKHHATAAIDQSMVSLEIGKGSSLYTGYEDVHQECSKLLLPQDRKTILSMKSRGSGHIYTEEAMKVDLLHLSFISVHILPFIFVPCSTFLLLHYFVCISYICCL